MSAPTGWNDEAAAFSRAAAEYDRRAAAWVRNRFPGACPDLGSVELSTDCAAYASGGWAQVYVSWAERGDWGQPRPKCCTLFDEAWHVDLTTVIREIVDMPLDGIQLPSAKVTGGFRSRPGD